MNRVGFLSVFLFFGSPIVVISDPLGLPRDFILGGVIMSFVFTGCTIKEITMPKVIIMCTVMISYSCVNYYE